jgi:hypothetical protein
MILLSSSIIRTVADRYNVAAPGVLTELNQISGAKER